MTDVIGYHHLSLSVSDLETSVDWYQQVLGLDVAAEIDGEGFRRTRLRAPRSGVTLTLTRHDQQSGETFSERRPGMDHVALQVSSADEVNALKDRFEQLGVNHSQVKASNGTAMITLRDPDNIQIEVFGGALDPNIAGGRAGA
ncbi:MAG TPA: VOC family protein [Actinomycetota bacterium]|nr:VOC family protein [Actinomycetota bacterium]